VNSAGKIEKEFLFQRNAIQIINRDFTLIHWS